MHRRGRICLLLAGMLLLACPPLRAQEAPAFDAAAPGPEKPRRKQPSFFHRAEKDSALPQLQHADQLRAAGRTRKARKQYDALVHAWPNTPEAAVAQRALALLLLEAGRYPEAFDEFQYLIDNYSGQFPYGEALERQLQIANHVRTARHGRFLFFQGSTAPERALPMFEKIVQNAPSWEKAADAQFQIAQIHEEMKDYPLAMSAYEMILLRYPGSPLAAEASFGRAHCLYLDAQASPRNEEACRRALSAFSVYLKDYPAGAHAAVARQSLEDLRERLAATYFDRAVYYDRIARQPRAALIAYEDFIAHFPSSKLAAKAQERVRVLKGERSGDGT